MKILFVATNIGYGGASKMIACVANTLCEEHEVEVLTFRSEEIKQSFDKRIKLIHDTLYKNRCKPIEILGQILKLRQYVKKNKIDLIIAFLHPANYMSVIATKGTKTKVLLSERVDPISRMKNGKIFVHIIEKIIHHADAYVFQSKGAAEAYPSICQKRGRVIMNAIPNRVYPNYSPAEEKYILCAARIELKQKRQDLLVDAFSLFLQTHKDFKLYIAGDGPDEVKLCDQIKQLGIQENVVMLGARKDVLDLMAKSTFFVLTSDYEGIPNALLEAIAVGVPSISTDCSPGGARMIIDDGINGYIVPCGDSKTLSEKMCEMADDEQIRMKFSENCKSKATVFRQEEINHQWLLWIEEVCSF